MSPKVSRGLLMAMLLACFSLLALGQSFVLDLPMQSQSAVVSQRVGLTDITIRYHRPLVNNRKIWGGLVPYGQVWRAGANKNTTIEFSDPVMIEGKMLDKGVYGLHMIPGEDKWAVIFSKNSTSWGSFTYSEKEDALRVQVKPQPSEFHEALAYDFDDVRPDATTVTLRWEKLAVPFKIGVDTNKLVVASLHNQLRDLSQYTWMGWDDAASYLVDNKIDLDEALEYSDRSIQMEERFDNLMTKSHVLTALGHNDEAVATKAHALEIADPFQLHIYARQLQGQKKPEEAFEIFRQNAKKHPDKWFVHSGMARVYSSEGKYADALKEMQLALEKAPEPMKPSIQDLIKRLQANQDINN